MQKFKWLKIHYLPLILGLALSACGFHLRGHYSLPTGLSPIYIESRQPFDSFNKLLRNQLVANKIIVADTVENAAIVLTVLSTKEGQQLLSSSTTSQVNNYALNYTVHFELHFRDGRVILPDTAVSSTQNLTINSNQILASSTQQSEIYQQLRRDAVEQLMLRLNAHKVQAAFLGQSHEASVSTASDAS